MRNLFISFFFLGFLCISVWGQDSTGKQMIEKIAQEFASGNIYEAEILALKTLHSESNLSQEELFEVHKYLGFCYVAYGQRDKAIKEFLFLLRINKEFRFDNKIYSPKIVEVFEEALSEFIKLSETEKELNNKNPENIQLKAGLKSLVFPGRGQLLKGDKVKGYTLIGGESMILMGLLYSHIKVNQTHQEYLDETIAANIDDKYQTYNNWYKIRNFSAVTAAAVYLYSFFDGIYSPVKPSDSKISVKIAGNSIALTINF